MRVRLCLLTTALVALPLAAHAEWKPVEKVETYAISGQSGLELYRSIGQNGPNVGIAHAIAFTNFKLTWGVRDYKPSGKGCVLTAAKPKLIITYTLPSPSAPLPPAVQKSWEVFIAGVSAHEKVHGASMIQMVHDIEAATDGLTVADDPKCSKTRAEVIRRLDAISKARVQASRDFDRVELGQGGNLQKLILALVNGG
ncbi:peptidase [Mesorhizobium sp. SARCC-RB16n]|nr:peptidase [Mesorhizobium sp. SARCC-RB16n]